MKLTQRLSLRVRLTLLFLSLVVVAWGCASFVAWKQTTHKLNELFDTQQLLFAKRISAMDFSGLNASKSVVHPMKKDTGGYSDDDALAFAVFTAEGKRILHDGENGAQIPWHYQHEGFKDGQLQDDDDKWRFLWLSTPDKQHRIVVGQEKEYRTEMALEIILSQLQPWLVALPLMFLSLIILLSWELQPLKQLANALLNRAADADEPLDTEQVPGEVRPLVDALNQLFSRIQALMLRERRFTSDAAHELRSPLAALKVQADVAQLVMEDQQALEKALLQMNTGIERASRLVEQLLILSRLDSLDHLEEVQAIAMAELLQSAVMDIYPVAQQAGVDIHLNLEADNGLYTGQPLLLELLVRNLLDNAIRYSPCGSVVQVTLEKHQFRVSDNGPGVTEEVLTRLGERFWRPPGQVSTGSGLGLSIVKRIAALHKMKICFGHAAQGGFEVIVRW